MHGLDQPLSDDAGATVLSRFSFDEFKIPTAGGATGARCEGPFEGMLKASMQALRQAKMSRSWQANTETLQLLLIVSDGRILGEHQQVQRLVREAAEEGVLPVLVLLDYFANPGSASAGAATAAKGLC